MASKIIRDPLYNYIAIDLDRDAWLVEVLDSREAQRLRRVHQLGVSPLAYPGADHSRLSHSLGVVHLMYQTLTYLARSHPEADEERTRHSLLAAALLHDVGHGPFSHVLEPLLGNHHERWTRKIILDHETEVCQRLSGVNAGLPSAVAALLDEDNPQPAPWQKALLSSQLDLDRLDYLRRDSLFSGAGYGHFDWYRIIHTMRIEEHPSKRQWYLTWPPKTARAIEEYIFSRLYMYQNVYFHHTTRGYEQLLSAIWRRAKTLVEKGADVASLPPLQVFLSGDGPTTDQYLRIEEHHVLAQVDRWQESKDPVLADLSRRYLSRNGFRAVSLRQSVKGYEARDRINAALEHLKRAGFELPEYYLLEDDGSTKIYEPYYAEKEAGQQDPITAILIYDEADRPSPFTEISNKLPDRLGPVTGRRLRIERFYCPKEHESQVAHILQGGRGTR